MIKKFEKKDLKYLWYALYIPVYAIWFGILENIITNDYPYWVSEMKFDALIPFCEYFFIPYFTWYFYLAGILIFLVLTDRKDFGKYMQFIIIGSVIGLFIFSVFPNGQNLRVDIDTLGRDNFFTRAVGWLYSIDTHTNSLPSLHVVGAIAGAIAICDSKSLKNKKIIKSLVIIVCTLICMSTCFIKQHSFLDVIASVILCAFLYVLVYTPFCKWFIKLFVKKKNNNIVKLDAEENAISNIVVKISNLEVKNEEIAVTKITKDENLTDTKVSAKADKFNEINTADNSKN